MPKQCDSHASACGVAARKKDGTCVMACKDASCTSGCAASLASDLAACNADCVSCSMMNGCADPQQSCAALVGS